MKCDKCNSERILKCYCQGRDTHSLSFKGKDYSGYMREGLNLYGNYGDAMEFNLCMDCGKVQGKFPVTDEVIDEALKEEE